MLVNRGSPRRWRASFIAAMVTAFGLNVGAFSRAALRVFVTTSTRLGLATRAWAAAPLISFMGLTLWAYPSTEKGVDPGMTGYDRNPRLCNLKIESSFCTLPRNSASSCDDGGARGGAVSRRLGERPPAVGKTTLLREAFPHHRYVSLESPDDRAFALEDPRGFLGRFDGPVILDEAQRAPDLFSYIQTIRRPAAFCRRDRGTWPSTFRPYVERDVRDLTQVGDPEAFGRFVRLCAGRAGGLLNLSSLGNDCGVSHDTARRWLSVLEASFVTFRLQPYHKSFNRRLTRRAKLYFVDTGLLCRLLCIRDADQLASHAARGAVFENLVIAEALKVGCNAGETPDLFHWRDQRGNEIDLIVDTRDGPHAVEMKSGETVAGDFFKGLTRWRALAGRSVPATLVYGGGESHVRNGVDVRAWRDWM